MQDYSYSVFSIGAIAIYLIINSKLLFTGRGGGIVRGRSYRGFLLGILAYYVTDAAWGVFAGLGWTTLWYVDTIFFFLSLVAFVFMWCRFVIDYLDLGKRTVRLLLSFGYGLWAFNLVALAINPFAKCFFHIDAQGRYQTGPMRDPAFWLLIAFNILIAVFVLAKALRSRDVARRRGMMVFQCCVTLAAAMILQIVVPLTPFTALGCLLCNCFLHVFVIQDDQTARHMAKLEKALRRVREAERSRTMFFSIVSHDIRTPLNAILGYSELLQFGTRSEEEKTEALESIRASGSTLLALVNDVLDLAKMDAGKMTLQPGPVNLSRLTDEVFASFRMAAENKKIELVNRTAKVPTVMLDGHRIRQILFNLIGNAVKFTDSGSITVAASYTGMTLELAVADTGCGIPPDMLTRILDPFVQVTDQHHSADRLGGTGLGLSICRRLVELMGGELTVESELGKGSTFRANIPEVVTGREPAASDAEPEPLPKKALPKRVLIVDDSPVNRSVLTAFLKKAGVTSIEHAGDGAKALAKLDAAAKADTPYDFVFSDIWMPHMSGLEFIDALRADPRFKSLPCFAVTADAEVRGDARADLFTGVLIKPLTYAKLMEGFPAAESK